MKPRVTVIDYGASNLLNVVRAMEHCGAEVIIADQPEAVIDAGRLILPGVGAFADGMASLAEKKPGRTLKVFLSNRQSFFRNLSGHANDARFQ